jgi:hypothetical protein
MKQGLTISVVDPDDDYLGIEIRAANHRFAGTTRIYAGLDELSAFAAQIVGFPKSPHDERTVTFGHTDPGWAGGHARLRFHCTDGSGHTAIEIDIADDDDFHAAAAATFSIPVQPADLDRFLGTLRRLERDQCGEAVLPPAV